MSKWAFFLDYLSLDCFNMERIPPMKSIYTAYYIIIEFYAQLLKWLGLFAKKRINKIKLYGQKIG